MVSARLLVLSQFLLLFKLVSLLSKRKKLISIFLMLPRCDLSRSFVSRIFISLSICISVLSYFFENQINLKSIFRRILFYFLAIFGTSSFTTYIHFIPLGVRCGTCPITRIVSLVECKQNGYEVIKGSLVQPILRSQ